MVKRLKQLNPNVSKLGGSCRVTFSSIINKLLTSRSLVRRPQSTMLRPNHCRTVRCGYCSYRIARKVCRLFCCSNIIAQLISRPCTSQFGIEFGFTIALGLRQPSTNCHCDLLQNLTHTINNVCRYQDKLYKSR